MTSFFNNNSNRQQKIIKLYQEILGRDPDSDGLEHYTNNGLSFNRIENDLINSLEHDQFLKKIYDFPLVELHKNKQRSTTINFWDTDSERLFLDNQKKLGEEWIWYNRPIEYKLNSLGYRMNEFNEIDWDNYIAAFGCSFTAGVGLPLEETWSYKIANDLKCDLVNAGAPGAGNEFILKNIIQLLSQPKLPKFIAVSWSSLTRKTYPRYADHLFYGTFKYDYTLWDKSYQEYINNSNHWKYNFLAIKKTVDTLCKLAGIPVWHFSNFAELNIITDVDGIWPARPNYKISDINELNLIAGRDYEFGPECSHPGIQMNNDIYKKWKQKYKNNG